MARGSKMGLAAFFTPLLAACLALALIGFVPQAALAMSASFSWSGIAACKNVSPAFAIHAAPSATRRLRFMLHDEDAPHFHHGGSAVDYEGPMVGPGAISYIGPCPPAGETHHYVWTIEALDAKGKVLAKTTAAGVFPVK
jgi:phosphatidylethanolamine-binding protein (PEBP) family uncharacterized protein